MPVADAAGWLGQQAGCVGAAARCCAPIPAHLSPTCPPHNLNPAQSSPPPTATSQMWPSPEAWLAPLVRPGPAGQLPHRRACAAASCCSRSRRHWHWHSLLLTYCTNFRPPTGYQSAADRMILWLSRDEEGEQGRHLCPLPHPGTEPSHIAGCRASAATRPAQLAAPGTRTGHTSRLLCKTTTGSPAFPLPCSNCSA